MIKALILSHDFPPVTKVGALRAYSWYLDMASAAVYPVVVTRNWRDSSKTEEQHSPTGSLIECAVTNRCWRDQLIDRFGMNRFVLARKALSALGSLTKFNSRFGDDHRYIYQAADQWLSQNEASVIIATGEPFILFKYAHLLSKKYGIPYVLDYRDGWTTNHVRSSQGLLSKFLLSIEKRQEKRFIGSAEFFTSVSQQLVSNLAWSFEKELSPRQGRILPNGVELRFYEKEKPAPQQDFTICYTGTLYETQRVDIFLAGLKHWKAKNPHAKIKACFIGIERRPSPRVQEVIDFAKRYPSICEVSAAVPFQDAIDLQRSAHMLLSLIPGSQSKGIMAGKTYEYAATGNPILLIPSEPGRETTFFPGRDIQQFAFTAEETAAVIDHNYCKFADGESTATSITTAEIFEISRAFQTARFAEMLIAAFADPSIANEAPKVQSTKAATIRRLAVEHVLPKPNVRSAGKSR